MAEEDVLAQHPPAPTVAAPTPSRVSRGRSYEADVYGWAMDQAAHIRAGRYDLLDIANVAEEIESLGRHEFDVLVSYLEIVLQHMLKWDYQPEWRSRSWALSIAEHRRRVTHNIKDNPSLKPRRDEAIERAYELARMRAANETDLPLSIFPGGNNYTWADIIERPFVHGVE